MNVASAQTIQIASPPLLSALAQSISPAPGPAAQGTNLLDAFLSLLAGFAAQDHQGEEIGLPATKAGQPNKKEDKKEDKKDSLAALFAAVPIRQADAQLPFKLAFPPAIANMGLFTDALTPKNAPANDPPLDATPGPASLAIPEQPGNKPTVLPNLQLGPLSPAPLLLPVGANLRAPIAFAIRLEEAMAGGTPVATGAPAAIEEAGSGHAPGITSTSSPTTSPAAIEEAGSGHAQPTQGQPLAQQIESVPSPSPTGNAAPAAAPPIQPLESVSAVSAAQTAAPPPFAAQPAESLSPPPAATQAAATPVAPAPAPDPNAATAGPKIAAAPNVVTAPNARSSERTIQFLDPQEAIRRPAHSQAAVTPDDGSTKHDEPAGIPPVTHAIPGNVRAEPDLTREAAPQTGTRTDSHPIPAQETEVRDTSTVLRPQPAREISMRLTPAESPSVDIMLVDRAGSVHVAVRTPDTDLARNLQSGLSDLVHRLERKGFEAEAWSPGDSSASKPASSVQANGNDSASQGHGRDPREGAQQNHSGQHNHGRNRPKWVAELEQRLTTADLE